MRLCRAVLQGPHGAEHREDRPLRALPAPQSQRRGDAPEDGGDTESVLAVSDLGPGQDLALSLRVLGQREGGLRDSDGHGQSVHAPPAQLR